MIEFLLGAAVSAALYYACYMAGRESGREEALRTLEDEDDRPVVMEHRHGEG